MKLKTIINGEKCLYYNYKKPFISNFMQLRILKDDIKGLYYNDTFI